MNKLLLHPAAKPLWIVLACLPAAWLVWGVITNTLGANPAEAVIRGTGDWVLRALCLALAITPLREALGWQGLARFRRITGVTAFVYGALHALAYAWLDMGLDWGDIVRDIPKRPFVLVGTAAMLWMTPLAATSFNRAIKALGAARWRRLHQGVYGIVLLGLLHYFWMRAAKHNFAEWSIYAVLVAGLLGWRVRQAWRRRRAAAARLTS